MQIRRSGRRVAGAVVLLVSGLSAAPPLMAIEDIVVTTRKSEENLQDVPIAVTAFSAKTIDEARIENLDDVAAMTPGLNFFNPIGDVLPVPVIRGVAPTDIFGEPNAAVFVDGVFAAGREGLNFSLLEVERIEVSKGPQSALYGRNAFSGAINYVTQRPAAEFESTVEGTLGNDGRGKIKGMVSGPVIADVLGIRLAAAYDSWDGSYDNPISSEDVGGYTYKTFLGNVEWTPTDNTNLFFKAYFSDDEVSDSAITGEPANCENVGPDNGPNRRLANLCGEVADLDTIRARNNAGIVGNPNIRPELQFLTGEDEIPKIAGAKGEERQVTRLSLHFNWDLAFGTVTSVTGYSRVEEENITDGTRNLGYAFPFTYCSTVLAYVDAPANTVPICLNPQSPSRFTTGEFVVSPKDTTKDFSQELRFIGPQEKRLRYSLGAYFYNTKVNENAAALLASAPFLPPGLGDPTGPGTLPPGAAFGPFVATGPTTGLAIGDPAFRPWFTPTSTLGQDEFTDEETTSWAVFATGDFDVNDLLTLDAQLRWTEEDKDFRLTAPALGQARDISKTFDFVTGRLGLRYRVSEDWMLYSSVSNGTKSGGFDPDVVDVLTDPNNPNSGESRIVIVPFDEEQLLAYEVGVKGTTPDGKLSLDIAVYKLDWQDIIIPQVFQNDPISGDVLEQPEGFNTNAGDATVWGWEIQGKLALSESLEAGFGASFTDATMDNAKLESFADFPSFAPDGDVSGNKLLRQPEWMANASLSYERQLFGDWEGSGRLDVTYQDKYFGGLDNQWTIPSHTYVNLRLALRSERYEFSLWAKNLFEDDSPTAAFRDVYFGNTDDIYLQQPASSTPHKFFPWRITTTQPRLRTFGLTAKVRFGAAR